jgi:hypothetical protein
MKLRYIIPLIVSLCLSVHLSANAELARTPQYLKPCLSPNPLYVTPQQYREFSKISSNGVTYFYMYNLLKKDQFPDGVLLLKVQGNRCERVGGQFLGLFQDISQYVPQNVALALTEAKWRSLLKFKDGPAFLKSVLSTGDVRSKNGESLSPISLPSIDRQALKKIGVLR